MTQVDSANPPLWAAVGTNVKSGGKKPVSYPRVLNDSDKTHYRAGPNAGRGTKGWLGDMPGKVTPDIVKALGELASDLKAGWRHG